MNTSRPVSNLVAAAPLDLSGYGEAGDAILAYEKAVGTRFVKSERAFIELMTKRHGKLFRRFEELEIPGGVHTDSFWEAKNQDVAFSIDYTIGHSGYLYKSFFERLHLLRPESPTRILDVGCENGYVTCFLGALYPNAEVVGIDKIEAATKVGTELASRLALKNVRFQCCDITQLPSQFPVGYFDVIVGLAVFYILAEFPEPIESLKPLPEKVRELSIPTVVPWLKAVHEVLNPTGILLSAERTSCPAILYFWSKLLQSQDLDIDWQRSGPILFKEIVDFERKTDQTIPFLFVRPGSPESSDGDVLKHVAAYELETQMVRNQGSQVFNGLHGETFFHMFNPKKFLEGREFHWHSGGVERLEFWECGPLLLRWMYTNLGGRELTVFSANQMDAINSGFDEMEGRTPDQGELRPLESSR